MAARLYECMAASRYNLAPSRERMALKLHDVYMYKAQRKSWLMHINKRTIKAPQGYLIVLSYCTAHSWFITCWRNSKNASAKIACLIVGERSRTSSRALKQRQAATALSDTMAARTHRIFTKRHRDKAPVSPCLNAQSPHWLDKYIIDGGTRAGVNIPNNAHNDVTRAGAGCEHSLDFTSSGSNSRVNSLASQWGTVTSGASIVTRKATCRLTVWHWITALHV